MRWKDETVSYKQCGDSQAGYPPRAEKIAKLDAELRKAEQDEYVAAFARVMQEIIGDE